MCLITSMKPTLAKAYSNQNPKGMIISEKLDGVRAIWDGAKFISRTGKTLKAPAHIVEAMPKDIILDGELFGGRGNFQKSVGEIIKGNWDGIEFVIFDVVTSGKYRDRMNRIKEIPSFCRVLDFKICKGKKDLSKFEKLIISKGGEGVMLRKADAQYEHKRTSSLLKLKRFKTDEAIVEAYQDGEGKNDGKVGALVVKWAGKIFKLGTGFTDEERDTPPTIGSKVTFKYFELTDGGIPRFPSFVAVRNYE